MDVVAYKSKYKKVFGHEPNLFATIMHDCGKIAYYDLDKCTYLDEVIDITQNGIRTAPTLALW